MRSKTEILEKIVGALPCGEPNCPVGGYMPGLRAVRRLCICRTGMIAAHINRPVIEVALTKKGHRKQQATIHQQHCLPLVRRYWPKAEVDPESGMIKRVVEPPVFP